MREERERLGLDQADLLTPGVTTRTSVYNYESGKRSPDAEWLAALAHLGFDVLYILTGSRSFVPPDPLSPREAVLLDNYRRLAHDAQRTVEGVAAQLAAGLHAAPAPAPAARTDKSRHQTFHAPVQSVVGKIVNKKPGG